MAIVSKQRTLSRAPIIDIACSWTCYQLKGLKGLDSPMLRCWHRYFERKKRLLPKSQWPQYFLLWQNWDLSVRNSTIRSFMGSLSINPNDTMIRTAERVDCLWFAKAFWNFRTQLKDPTVQFCFAARSDLSFYNWDTQHSTSNESPNFQILPDHEQGLLFKNKRDRKARLFSKKTGGIHIDSQICPNPTTN